MSEGHQEIIIIKRHGDHEDGHHGGAWKIALADFMTAMMALFLVMWLINSTSKEQKQTIAEYFNPVKLAEVTHDKKGLRDPHDTPSEPGAEGGKAEGKGGEGKGEGKGEGRAGDKASEAALGSRSRESALFQDPYAVLARLAAEGDRGDTASSDAAAVESGQPGISGGDAARDPFDPLYWQVEPLPRHRTERPGKVGTAVSAPSENRLDAAGQVASSAKPRDPKDAPTRVASADDGLPLTPKDPAKDAAKSAALKAPAPLDAPKDGAKDQSKDQAKDPKDSAKEKAAETAAVAAMKAEIAKAVAPLAAGTPTPKVEVRRSGEGILISITDEIDFSMFGVGSAEPTPKVVKALEKIAKVINSRPGRIVVRGHTDARPFRSETYDNWRLSTARAQMASYMLVRGGVDESRIERIEGYADRQPRNPADPKAAENRRIEILVRGLPE